MTYLVRHWRGELSGTMSWWVNSVGLTLLLWILMPQLAVAGHFASPDTLAKFCVALALGSFQIGFVPLWQMVGLWRCGGRQATTRGTRLSGRVTQVSAFLFTVFIAMRVLVFGAESLVEARLALALGPYSYTVSLLPNQREIQVRGGFGFGVSRAVAELLKAHPGVRRIRLDSGGGALSEGQQLRAIIRAHQLDTYSLTGCSSACVSAFVGGRFRFLQRGALMGFHLPRNWATFSTNPVTSGYRIELGYFRIWGLPDWFLARWISTGQKFWYPTNFQLVSSGLVTGLLGQPPPLTRSSPRALTKP